MQPNISSIKSDGEAIYKYLWTLFLIVDITVLSILAFSPFIDYGIASSIDWVRMIYFASVLINVVTAALILYKLWFTTGRVVLLDVLLLLPGIGVLLNVLTVSLIFILFIRI